MEAVLAAHRRLSWAPQPFTCACDPDTSDGTTSHHAHVAAAVLDWLRTELAAEGMREAVSVSLGFSNCSDDDATAALEAVAERLAGGER